MKITPASGAAVALMLARGGCASSGIVTRRLPPETPAADNAAAIKRAEALARDKTQAKQAQQNGDAAAPPVTPAEARLDRASEATLVPTTDFHVPAPRTG